MFFVFFCSFFHTGISALVDDLKPALLTTINTEFEKVAGQTAPAPTKGPSKEDGPGEASGSGAAADSVLDDIFPRVDISGRIAPIVVVCPRLFVNHCARERGDG